MALISFSRVAAKVGSSTSTIYREFERTGTVMGCPVVTLNGTQKVSEEQIDGILRGDAA